MVFRCGAYLGGVLAIVTTFIAGCNGQCSVGHGDPQPAMLYADHETRTIYSPQYGVGHYPPNSNCGWRIVANYGYIIRLYAKDVRIESSSSCRYDSVSLYDGYEMKGYNLLAKICSQEYGTYISSGRYMYINFTSDSSDESAGFALDYRAVSLYDSSTTTHRPPWAWTTYSTTTTTSSYSWSYSLNSAALIGGLAGALMLICFLIAMCRYCYNRSAYGRTPRPAPRSSPYLASGLHPSVPSHAYQNRDGVYMIPGSGYSSPAHDAGNYNLGYSEPPPSYESIQSDSSFEQVGTRAPPTAPPEPPSYTEATMGIDPSTNPKPE